MVSHLKMISTDTKKSVNYLNLRRITQFMQVKDNKSNHNKSILIINLIKHHNKLNNPNKCNNNNHINHNSHNNNNKNQLPQHNVMNLFQDVSKINNNLKFNNINNSNLYNKIKNMDSHKIQV